MDATAQRVHAHHERFTKKKKIHKNVGLMDSFERPLL